MFSKFYHPSFSIIERLAVSCKVATCGQLCLQIFGDSSAYKYSELSWNTDLGLGWEFCNIWGKARQGSQSINTVTEALGRGLKGPYWTNQIYIHGQIAGQ